MTCYHSLPSMNQSSQKTSLLAFGKSTSHFVKCLITIYKWATITMLDAFMRILHSAISHPPRGCLFHSIIRNAQIYNRLNATSSKSKACLWIQRNSIFQFSMCLHRGSNRREGLNIRNYRSAHWMSCDSSQLSTH